MLLKLIRGAALVAPIIVLAACDTDASVASGIGASAPGRAMDVAHLDEGRRLYQEHCAACHGPDGEGTANWRERKPDGTYPPPPLNGGGHAWHHPRAMLLHVIRKGSPGGGRMPAWAGKLSDREIEAIVDWFQSQWPNEVYRAWVEIDRRARPPQT